MKSRKSRNTDVLPAPKKALAYARVSSKEQDKEGFSIPAQQKLLQAYATQNGITIEREYVDIETAKHTGRLNFEEMVRYLKRHDTIRIVLVEKTDRLYRNLKDWVTLDELDIEIHLVKEGIILSRDSKSSEKFVHGIKVLMAKNYIDNLSEEARKGQQEKAEQGIWPTKAPLGYLNTTGPDGKKIIVPDPEKADAIAHLFGWYATGTLSMKEVAKQAQEAGLCYRKSGKPLPVSGIHWILRNRIYTGEFDWNGHLYKGRHQPLISRELWERVQGILDGRNAKKPKPGKPEFAYIGMMTCGRCGCAITAEIKKRRYVYYHCSGSKGKCTQPYVREEVLSEQFSKLLGRLDFGKPVVDWLTSALQESHADERREHDAAVSRLQAEYERLQHRIHAIYIDKLDGKVDTAFFEKMTSEWRIAQDRCLREIGWHQSADQSYLQEGVQILAIAQSAGKLFTKQDAKEKRRLLEFVISNSVLEAGTIEVTFRQPFDLLFQTAIAAAKSGGENGSDFAGHPAWLRYSV